MKTTKGIWHLKKSTTRNEYKVIGRTLGYRYKIAVFPFPQQPGEPMQNQREELEAQANAEIFIKSREMLHELEVQLAFLIYCRDNMQVPRAVFDEKILQLKKIINK